MANPLCPVCENVELESCVEYAQGVNVIACILKCPMCDYSRCVYERLPKVTGELERVSVVLAECVDCGENNPNWQADQVCPACRKSDGSADDDGMAARHLRDVMSGL